MSSDVFEYKLIPLHEVAVLYGESVPQCPSLDEIQAGLNLLASHGWRVVAVADGHILVLEREVNVCV